MAKSKGKADKDVIFRIGVTSIPESKRALKELGDAALAIQRGLDRSMARVGQVAKESTQSIAAGMQAAIRSSEQSIRSSISSMAKDAKAQLDSFRASTATAGTMGGGSSSATAPRTGEYARRGPGNRPIPVPMAAGERLTQEIEAARNPTPPAATPPEAPRRPDTFTAGMNRGEAAQRARAEREERIERESNIREAAAEAARAAREDAAAKRKEQAAAAAAQRQADADTRREAAELARQQKAQQAKEARERAAEAARAAREQASLARQQAAQQAKDAIEQRETGNQNVQRGRNLSTAKSVGMPAQDESKFQAMALAEQEKYIAQKLQNETAVYTSIKGLRGADLTAYRQAVALKVQDLNALLAATKQTAGEGHAVESRAVQSTLRQRQQTIKSAIGELNKYDAELKRQAAAEDAMAERLHQRHRQRQLATARANRQAREQSAAGGPSAPAGLNSRESAQFESAVGRVTAANRAMNEPIQMVVESLGRATRGFAQLGLLSESTTEGLLKGWIRIQSVFDIALGVSKAVTGIANAQRLFSDATKASQVATNLSTVASTRQAAALAREAAAASLATSAHGRLAAARAAGAVSGNAGAVASGASTLASGARLASAGAGAAGIGSAAGGAAIPAAGGAALTGGAWIAAIGGATAATLSLVETIKNVRKYGFGQGAEHGSVYDQVATAEASGLGYAAQKLGSKGFDQAMQVGSAGLSNMLGDFFAPFKQLGETNLATQRAEKRDAESKANREKLEQQGGVRAGSMRSQFEIDNREQQFKSQLRSDTAPQNNPDARRLKTLQTQIQNTQDQIASLPVDAPAAKLLEAKIQQLQKQQRSLTSEAISPELTNRDTANKEDLLAIKSRLEAAKKLNVELAATNGSESEKTEAAKIIAELSAKENELSRERFAIEKQIVSEKQRGTETAIAGIRTELDLRRQQQREAEAKLKSGAERFGDLDVLEQRKLLMAKSKSTKAADQALSTDEREQFETLNARSASPRGLSAEDQQRLEQLRQKRAQASGAVLSREERQGLAGLGFKDDIAAASEGSRAAAKRAGFDTAFGGEERTDANIAKSAQRKLAVELKNKTEVLVSLESDTEAIANEAVKKMLPLWQAERAELVRLMEAKAAKELAALNEGHAATRKQAESARR